MSKNITMDDLLTEESIKQLVVGDVVDATVMTVKKHQVWLDLGSNGIGLVIRREISRGQELEVGQVINASVIDTETDDGFAIVSLKKAAKDRGWDDLEKIFNDKETLEVQPYDANR